MNEKKIQIFQDSVLMTLKKFLHLRQVSSRILGIFGLCCILYLSPPNLPGAQTEILNSLKISFGFSPEMKGHLYRSILAILQNQPRRGQVQKN
jgi:hypothetical protein